VLGPGGWSRPIGVRALVETSEMLATCRDCIAWQSWHSCHLQSHPRRHQACMAPVFVRRGKTRDRVSLDTTLHAMLNSSRALTCLAYVMVSSEPNAPYLRLVVRGAGNASLLQIGRHRAARQPLRALHRQTVVRLKVTVQPIVLAKTEREVCDKSSDHFFFFFFCLAA
jgi:hypothetical protein